MNQTIEQPPSTDPKGTNVYTVRYGLLGAAFGLLFPVLATVVLIRESGGMLSLGEIIELHLSTPLLLIIDSAPIFLGLLAAMVGRREDRL